MYMCVSQFNVFVPPIVGLDGYVGTPPNCLPECTMDSDCSSNKLCIQSRCAEPRDSCPSGGCEPNAHCRVVNKEKICVCNNGFLNDTRLGCLASECRVNSDCSDDKVCRESRCENACSLPNNCPENSVCVSENHEQNCRPECSIDSDCSKDQVCHQNRCSERCAPEVCGFNAICKLVERKPVCTCPPGFTGMASLECVRSKSSKVVTSLYDAYQSSTHPNLAYM
jgi:hypothetical protein